MVTVNGKPVAQLVPLQWTRRRGPSRGLLDTSVFITAENGRSLKEEWLPTEAAISVVTMANCTPMCSRPKTPRRVRRG